MVNATCTIEGCEKPLFGKGMCNMHYSRARRHGDPSVVAKVWYHGAACSAEGCKDPADSKGLCSKHYQRMRTYGQLEVPDRRNACSVEGCDRNGGHSRMCTMHRKRLAKHGDAKILRRNSAPPETCTLGGCERPHLASGFCSGHLDAHYRATNPGRFAAKDARRRMGEQASMTPADRAESARYRNLNLWSPCSFCGAPADTNDHVLAIADGGTDHWWNLTACCKSCNSSKGAKGLLQFLLYRNGGGAGGRQLRSGAAPGSV